MSAGLKKESYYQHVSLLACYLISNLIVSCLIHFNNIISACFPKYTLFFLGGLRVAYILSQERITQLLSVCRIMRMNRRNSPAWTQVRGEIAPWTARFDVFVKHRSPSKHNSYRHFAAQCSESESVYATRSTKNVQALIFLNKKRTAIVLLSFRRRYFTMGIVKIYNVLGGFYVNYSITCSLKCLLS